MRLAFRVGYPRPAINSVSQQLLGCPVGKILLTGGAGYIGSHICLSLLSAGYTPIILDNFSNSNPAIGETLLKISGGAVHTEIGDVTDRDFLAGVFKKHSIDAVIHLAGFKSIPDSISQPMRYYRNNVGGMTRLLEIMEIERCPILVFSSSAAVYGSHTRMPVTEDAAKTCTNPYAHTKLLCEEIIAAHRKNRNGFRYVNLRYFNPAGAHPSGWMGEDPLNDPTNLIPHIGQVASGLRHRVKIFGDDYETPDGTGVRDYIHVMDLAEAHVAALKYLESDGESGPFNLGSGVGHSVLEVIEAFERAYGRPIVREVAARRKGDVAICYADVGLAGRMLRWKAEKSLDQICEDAWRWQSNSLRVHGRPSSLTR